MNPTQPRLLPDFAAVPTRTERAGARRYWQQCQTGLDLFADPAPVAPCAVCGSVDHQTDACQHGTAPSLFGTDCPSDCTCHGTADSNAARAAEHAAKLAAREACRFTDGDRARIDARIAELFALWQRNGWRAAGRARLRSDERETLIRVALGSVGLGTIDCRDSELEHVAARVDAIAAELIASAS